MEKLSVSIGSLTIKAVIAHTITYFLMGIIASSLFDYASRLARPDMICWFRQFDDPMIMAGPLFQPIRGFIFALVFFPFREILFEKKGGRWLMSWLLIGLGILSTFGPAPGSVEGLIFTTIPIIDQLTGWLEIIPQAILFALLLHFW